MNIQRFTVALAVAGALCTSVGYAQTPAPAPSTTSPSSASSPSQRDATHSTDAEAATTTSGTDPANASTPAQREAMKGDSGMSGSKHQMMMKDCMSQQAAKNAGMAKSDMTKACNEQMKAQKDHSGMSKAPAGAPKDSEIGAADAPK